MPLPFEPSNSHFEALPALYNTYVKDLVEVFLTPLQRAASNGDLTLVQKLLETGEDVNRQVCGDGYTPLFLAIGENHAKIVKALIKAGADINFKADNGQTPLLYAVDEGRYEVAKILIECGANLEARTAKGNTLVHMTACVGNVEFLNFLIGKGMDINAKNVSDLRPLHYAITFRRIEVAKALLRKGADVNPRTKNSGLFDDVTPLILAVESGVLELMTILLNAGADIENKTGAMTRPLHIACEKNFSDIVRTLLEKNCEVNCKDMYGFTPLHFASDNGHKEIAIILLMDKRVEVNSRTHKNATPLHLAALKGHLEVIKLLISKGAELSAKDSEGSTPLHIAVQFSNQEVCDFLIKNGASLKAANNEKWTPLHEACYSGFSVNLVKQLIEKGSLLNAKCKDGRSVVHLAAENNHPDVVKLLIEKGADVGVFDNSGKNALHVGAIKNSLEVVKLLINRVANINAKAKYRDGETALHFAAELNHFKVAEVLLENGADVNVQLDTLLKTPFHLAAVKGLNKLSKLLLKYNPSINIKDKEGRTPLHCAVAHLHVSLVKQLLQDGADINARVFLDLNLRLDYDFTPLHTAASAGRADVAKALLRRGACFDAKATDIKSTSHFILPINLARDRSHTPLIKLFESIGDLFTSVINDDVDNIEHCIERGAIVNARNNSGRTVLHYAVFNNNIISTDVLLRHQADLLLVTNKGNTPLHTAVSGGNVILIYLLLDYVKKVNFSELLTLINAKTTGKGTTVLHMAAEMNIPELVVAFLELGAVYSVENHDAKTPLQLTSNEEIKNLLNEIDRLFKVMEDKGEKEAVELSTMDKAVMNARNTNGCTILYLAISKGHLDNALFLINNGADIVLVNQEGNTPLHLAAAKGNSEVVKAILEQEKNTNPSRLDDLLNYPTTYSGSSALHLASSAKVARALLQYGAVYNLKNRKGKTPFDLTKNKIVRDMLKTVTVVFKDVEKGNEEFIKKVSNLEAGEFEAVTNARNEQGQKLLQVLQASTSRKMLNHYKKILKDRSDSSQP